MTSDSLTLLRVQTRANLPTIAADEEDSDDDGEVEVLDATGKLEALKKRTYDTLEAKGLQFTPAPETASVEEA